MGGVAQPFAYGYPGGLPLSDGNNYFPGRGNVFFVDPAKGNDGQDGATPATAMKTITKAFAACVADQNDTIILLGSVASGNALAAQLNWNKNAVHLIGCAAPTFANIRSRITFSANFSPGIIVSASGCHFKNVYITYGRGSAANLIALQVTGARNVFENVHLIVANATEAQTAAFVLLDLSGAQECHFKHCTIGDTTITRAGANAWVNFSNSAGRILFEDCTFLCEIAADTAGLFVRVTNAVNAIQEFAIFRFCTFLCYSINQAAKLAAAFIGGPATGGVIALHDCGFIGCTKVAVTNAAQIWIISSEGNTAATEGLSVNPA